MPEKPIIDQIKHYQRDIVKSPDDSKRMLRCIERLTVLPVTIAHLQETGVGRSVNELRKCGGEVGAAANSLVCKWKSMVKEEEEVEESAPESDVEIDQQSSSERSTTADSKNHSSNKSQSLDKHKQVRNSEHNKKPDLNHTSNKKTDSARSESRSSMSSQHKPSSKPDHKSNTDRSAKTGSTSSSSSVHNSSQRPKSDQVSKSLKNPNSSHKSELECNGSSKNEKSNSKTNLKENKQSKSSSSSSSRSKETKDIKPKHEKDTHKREESSNRYNSPKKYEIKSEDSDSTDDETLYKPSNRKRKKSDSGEERRFKSNKHSKKTSRSEFVKKRNYDTSEDSNKSDSSGEEDNACTDNSRDNVDSHSEKDEEVSNKSSAEENLSCDEQEDNRSDDNSSAEESEDGGRHSGKNSDSEKSDDSSEEEKYVPVKIKKERESPPRHSKHDSSGKNKHNNVKSSSYTSSSHSNRSKTDNVTVKEEKYEDIKVKKEKNFQDISNTQKQKEVRSSSEKKVHKTSSSHSESTSKHSSKSDKKVKVKIEKEADGSIDCESGASFADALLGLSDTKKKAAKRKSTTTEKSIEKSPKPAEKSSVSKHNTATSSESRSSLSSSSTFKQPDLLSKHVKLEPLDVDLKSTLPEISPHYKPLPHYSPPSSPAHKKAKQLTQEEALSTIMSTKNQRTKVYSGNKTGYAKVPSLFDLCIQVLRDNIEALEYTGGVPYDLLKPVLDRATADQLYQLEHYNPYLVEDTDGLWQFHCNKDFRGKKPEEFETWRELYLRLLDEREKKLEALKANITQSMAKNTPIRQTKLAYVDSVVKPPRNVARKQMKYGTSKAVKHELVSKAMVGAASSSPAPEVVSVPAPSRPNTSNSFPIPNFLKKKKAPLMAKTLQLIKGNRFKR